MMALASLLTRIISSRFFRFLTASGISVIVNVTSRIAIASYVGYLTSIIVSYIIGILTAWTLNRIFVFKRSKGYAAAELSRFILVNIVGLVQVSAISVLLARYIFPFLTIQFYNETIAHIIGLFTLSFTSYILHKNFTFR